MNYYQMLGVKTSSSEQEIKKAYLNLIKKYHPDLYKGDKDFAQQKTAEINSIYNTLKDNQKRIEYDRLNKLNSFASVENYPAVQQQNNNKINNNNSAGNIFSELAKRWKTFKDSNINNQPVNNKTNNNKQNNKINKQNEINKQINKDKIILEKVINKNNNINNRNNNINNNKIFNSKENTEENVLSQADKKEKSKLYFYIFLVIEVIILIVIFA